MDDVTDRQWDGVMVVAGYEKRSLAIAESIQESVPRRVALAYETQRVLSFHENMQALQEAGYRFFGADPKGVGVGLDELLEGWNEDRPFRLAIDYSSMDRDLIASVAQYLTMRASKFELLVTFLYSEGDYESVDPENAAVITVNRPATGLSGWTAEPSAPLIAVVGLGYESDLALAALESLEPSDTFLYEPAGKDTRFDSHLWVRNESLMASFFENISTYDISQPLALYRSLRSFVEAHLSERRIALIPLGPKVFAIVSALIAAENAINVSYWRVSPGTARTPRDRLATGIVSAFDVRVLNGKFAIGGVMHS